MSAEAYFDMDQQEPIPLRADPAEVDAFLDRVETEAVAADVPVMAQIEWVAADDSPVLQFGVSPATGTGFVGHIAQAGSAMSTGPHDGGGSVAYDYMGNERLVPSSAEIDLPAVRRAVRHFVVSRGARDETLTWRPLD